MAKREKSVLVVSDLHLGSIEGIMPDPCALKDGNEVRANPRQAELLVHWKEMLDE